MNVIRGMHFQRTPHGQAKLVTCISGEIQDVVLNTELSSDDPTISYFDLSAKRGDVLFIPKGYAHGFQAKYEDTEVLYAVNATYRPDFEISINPLDPDLGIKWNRQPILSKKDSLGITYREWMSYKSQES
jgi:dTDP-4-dehydrorhamnose 3,5-epimerase